MRIRKIRFKILGNQGLYYRIFVILINTLFFKVGAKQAMANFGALGASLIWNSINMILYFLYHTIFAKFFMLGIPTKGCVLWLTGLSGSGKTTLAKAVKKELENMGKKVVHLDGDTVRKGLSKDLGFSLEDRRKNLERVGELATLLSNNDIIVICSFISPIRKVRKELRKKIKNFIEIFIDAPLKECEKRDVKGIYFKARKGKIRDFTGIGQRYEKPNKSEITCKTKKETIEESVSKIINYLKNYENK